MLRVSSFKPLDPIYTKKAILCRGQPTGLWKECNTKKPEHDDLSIVEPNPGFEGYKIH